MLQFNSQITLYNDLMGESTTFDYVEVHPVKEEKDYILDNGEISELGSFYEQCEEHEAEMWSIYIHMPENGIECIADCDTKETANALADMLLKTGKLFIRNI